MRKLSAIFSAVSRPYSFSHMERIQPGIKSRSSGAVKERLPFSLEIFLRTPFTKPERTSNRRFFASFTASLQTAESGTRSMKRIWYADILKIVRITGFIFFTFTLENRSMTASRRS